MPVQPAQLLQIVTSVRKGTCTAFLGAAVNRTTDGYDGLPLGGQLSQLLATGIDETLEKIADKNNLAKVSLVYECLVARRPLIDEVKKQIPDKERKPSAVLKLLAKLPIDLYVTTNYDRLLERALETRNPFVVVQTPEEIHGAEQVLEWIKQPKEPGSPPRRPLVYKIHGSFVDTHDVNGVEVDDSPLIITEADYIDFLTLLGSSEQAIPQNILSRFAVDTLLFLGYSLEDWDFRVLYKLALKKSVHKNGLPHYSVQMPVAQHWKDYWLAQSNQRLRVLESDVYKFAEDLEKEWDKG